TALTAYTAARKLVRERGTLPVPARYRPGSTALDRSMGHGQGYKYPHDFEGHYVAEDYLPDAIAGETIYEPSSSGYEAEMKARHDKNLAAKAAAPPTEQAAPGSNKKLHAEMRKKS
ncbi:MAG TPA: hypothetical protein VGM39_10400, partial [Kofleriaceae bacterium]